MVDNFLSAGTQDDDELPSPYGTGPKNRTTEEHRRSDYGDDTWRDRGNGLGLDPSPSLPSAPRSYERGPVPQQPYVPKPPYLPEPPPPPTQQQQQRAYGDQPQQRPYGEPPQRRPEYYGGGSAEPGRGEPGRGEPGRGEPGRGEPGQNREESPFGQYQEQSPYRPQQPQQAPAGPPQQQGRPSPFGPGSNGVPPNTRPVPPPGPPQQRQPAPPHAGSNGVTPHPPAPHGSNGTSNWSAPAPAPAPGGHNNGVTSPPPQQAQHQPPQPQAQAQSNTSSQGATPPPPGQQPSQPNPRRAPEPANPPRGNNLDTPTITAYLPEMLEGKYGQESGGQSDNGYLSDPSAEYESNTPVSEQSKPVGARRRADVQQDAPSQVAAEHTGSHRARRAQPAPSGAQPSGPVAQPTGSADQPAASVAEPPAQTPPQNNAGSPGNASSTAPGEGSKRPRRYRIHHLRDLKNRGEKWAMLTAYDQYTAEIFDQAGIPVLLVGDSAANNVFGYETTLRVTVDELIPLARAVAGAVERALVVADLPFGSYQASPEQAFHTAVRFMKEAGVHAVKLEGGRTVVPMVEKLTQSGIPVMAHIGFTPQSEHSIGGYRVQGRGDQAAGLIDDAIALAEAGAFSVVLEMVPGDVAAEITKRVTIPTIGIGAGRDTDAQVLVWQDMAGMRSGTMPRFVKQYANLRAILTSAATSYAADVASGAFPANEHTF
ncbi:3-methyl-2-oxobutanoate hydroxymethyltransferase [Kribbella turkmenica]|uniref:3-methyl-2-oxobutanoate hydroxymethyltransferase n=1 Tax=Kribbella turkmenica TaxID=2530375 RepID=UPI00269FD698